MSDETSSSRKKIIFAVVGIFVLLIFIVYNSTNSNSPFQGHGNPGHDIHEDPDAVWTYPPKSPRITKVTNYSTGPATVIHQTPQIQPPTGAQNVSYHHRRDIGSLSHDRSMTYTGNTQTMR